MARRPDGALEHDIMTVLWQVDRALLPSEVNERLGRGLAYTTVATVLNRLCAKGLVERTGRGRAFVYAAVVPESELAGRRIADALSSASDRRAALAWFVRSLSDRDADAVRTILEDGGASS